MSGGGQVQWVLRWFTGQGQVGSVPLLPPHCGYQAAQEGASLLEKGLQTWADPLVLDFDS